MNLFKGLIHIVYHIAIVVLSAAIALSLPYVIRFLAREFLIYWAAVSNEKVFLISIEVVIAVILIILFNYLSRNWKERKFSRMARGAGLVFVSKTKGTFGMRRAKKLKEKQGYARDINIIGSTGFRTFVNSEGDLHNVMFHCREAKIMLLDPFGEGTIARAKSIQSPDITVESFREQIMASIAFLKSLKLQQKSIRLKLYPDTPLLKLAILGDYISVQHYHTGLDVREMPEYMFYHGQNPGSLYTYFYQYFLTRWHDPNIPEYDLDSDALVYRDSSGAELRRELFSEAMTGAGEGTANNTQAVRLS